MKSSSHPLLLALSIAGVLAAPFDTSVVAAPRASESGAPADVALDLGVVTASADPGLLQELLVRLIAPYTGPYGQRGKVDVYLGGLPAGLDLPIPPGSRIVGAVVKETAPAGSRFATTTEVVLDAPGALADLIDFFDTSLAERGWTVRSNSGPVPQRGFVGAVSPSYESFCGGSRLLNLSVTAHPGALADTRLTLSPAPEFCQQVPAAKPIPPGQEKLPTLYAPGGTPLAGAGGGLGGLYRWSSEATATTDRRPADLEAHFAGQLETLGWTRTAGGASGPLAWSTWILPGAGGWVGFLSVLDAGKGQRDLSVRVEQPGLAPITVGKTGP